MHSRRIRHEGDTVVLTFGHEGVLYRGAFVMYDRRTNTKWNHSNGLAMKGPLAGRRLDQLPARMMLWKEWKRQHPTTQVLVDEGPQNLLESLAGSMSGYRARASSVGDFGLGVGRGPRSTLYPFPVLKRKQVINDTAGRRPVVVVMESESLQTAVFSRRINDGVLSFERVEQRGDTDASVVMMRDRETGSLWDRLAGRALRGPLKGEKLKPMVGVTWDRGRWEGMYPDGRIYRPERSR